MVDSGNCNGSQMVDGAMGVNGGRTGALGRCPAGGLGARAGAPSHREVERGLESEAPFPFNVQLSRAHHAYVCVSLRTGMDEDTRRHLERVEIEGGKATTVHCLQQWGAGSVLLGGQSG